MSGALASAVSRQRIWFSLWMVILLAAVGSAHAAEIAITAAQGAAGTTVSMPVVLTLAAGEQCNKVELLVNVTPVGVSPSLTANLGYTNLVNPAAGMLGPTITPSFTAPNTWVLNVAWATSSSMFDMINGPATVTVGDVLVPLPSSAMPGSSYTVHLVPYDATAKTGTTAKVATQGPITTTLGPDVIVGVPLPTYALNLTGSHGQVEVNGTQYALPWSGNLLAESTASLEAVPDAHHLFQSWAGDLTGSDNPTSLVMDSDKSVSATFVLSFTDVPVGFWAYAEIEACTDANIVNGYPDNTYQPGNPVTRDQMAVYISRALVGGDANVPTGPATPSFSDVPTTQWAYKYIEYCYAQQVVIGFPDGTYQPSLSVDRGQMAVFIARAIATPTDRPDLISYIPPTTATFPDVPTSFWAFKFVEYIAQPSIAVTHGYPDGDYHPEYPCTRDQMAVYVARAFKLPM